MADNRMQSLGRINVVELFEAAASTDPVPGGGCVSAMCGFLGISLVLKAIRISARRRPDNTSYRKVEQTLLEIAPQLLSRAQADSDAFGLYIQAAKLPKDR